MAFMTAGGDFFVFEKIRYHISRYDIDTSAATTVFDGGDDFRGVECVRDDSDGGYYIDGGYSFMVEGKKELYYFYDNSNKQKRIDVFAKPGAGSDVKWAPIRRDVYSDKFRPYCFNPNSGQFVGTFLDAPNILAVCTLTDRGK